MFKLEEIFLQKANRTVAYSSYGAASATHTVLFFPGNMNSRLFSPAWKDSEAIAEEHDTRVVTVDRCGVGKSSGPLLTSYLEWVDIVDEFADTVSLPKSLHLAGYSSGGIYALAVACASRLSTNGRIASLSLISSDGEYTNPSLGVDVKEMYGGFTHEELSRQGKNLELAMKNVIMMENAYGGLKDPVRKEIAKNDLNESRLQGIDGIAQDCILESQPWPFSVQEETMTFPIYIHGGDSDQDVPPACSFWLKSILLTNATLFMYEKESHSMIRRKWSNILQTMTTTATTTTATTTTTTAATVANNNKGGSL